MTREITVSDVGSYSILCSQFKESSSGEPLLIKEIVEITRLLYKNNNHYLISKEGRQKVIKVLTKAKEEFKTATFLVVGTQAFREAINANEVIDEIKTKTGLTLRVLEPEEEATLSWIGALSGIKLNYNRVAVIDIGGGSSQLSIGSKESKKIDEIKKCSIPVGVAKLENLEEKTILDSILQLREPFFKLNPKEVIFCGGTITTLASLILGNNKYYNRELVHGTELSFESIRKIYNQFLKMSELEFITFLGCFEDRKGVIKRGTWFILKVMELLKIDTIKVSDRGVRWGIAINYFTTLK